MSISGEGLSVVDLFAGAGGLSLGFQKAGFQIVRAYDSWKPAIDTYRANFDHEVVEFNLSDYFAAADSIRLLEPDLLIGGPPCQDFSPAGVRQEGSRADLTVSFGRIVQLVSPSIFVMENVATALRSNAYKKAKCLLVEAGYEISELVLLASKFGVPQKRRRLFVIGSRSTSSLEIKGRILERESSRDMTLKEYDPDFPVTHYYRHPRSYSRRAVFSIHEPAPTIRGTSRPRPSTYIPHKLDTSLSKKTRALTHEERAKIQTFPPEFRWVGSSSEIDQLVGNAVPVKLAESVASAILEATSTNNSVTSSLVG